MYAHENPFRSDCVESLPFVASVMSPAELLLRLEEQGGRGSLVGPKGSGKTTLLHELAGLLRERGMNPVMMRLSVEERGVDWVRIEALSPETPFLLDGAEQLDIWRWRRVRRLTRQLPLFVTTSHTKAHLPLLHSHTTSPALLRMLVVRLLDGAPPDDIDIDELFRRNDGNIRLYLMALYDYFAVQNRDEG